MQLKTPNQYLEFDLAMAPTRTLFQITKGWYIPNLILLSFCKCNDPKDPRLAVRLPFKLDKLVFKIKNLFSHVFWGTFAFLFFFWFLGDILGVEYKLTVPVASFVNYRLSRLKLSCFLLSGQFCLNEFHLFCLPISISKSLRIYLVCDAWICEFLYFGITFTFCIQYYLGFNSICMHTFSFLTQSTVASFYNWALSWVNSSVSLSSKCVSSWSSSNSWSVLVIHHHSSAFSH